MTTQLVLGQKLSRYLAFRQHLEFLDERGPLTLYGFVAAKRLHYAITRSDALVLVTTEHTMARCALEQVKEGTA